MTKAQEITIKNIKDEIPHFDFYNRPERYEVKSFETEELESGAVSVKFITGMKNDEGTAAEAYCRKYRCCIIGKQGGIQCLRKRSRKLFRCSLFTFMNEMYSE